MEYQAVVSSNILGIAYDEPTQALYVEFTSGGKYKYSGVPQTEYEDFMAAGSKGSYLAQNIKDVYPATRV